MEISGDSCPWLPFTASCMSTDKIRNMLNEVKRLKRGRKGFGVDVGFNFFKVTKVTKVTINKNN